LVSTTVSLSIATRRSSDLLQHAAVGGGDGVIGSLADHGLGGFRHSIFLLAALRLQPGRRVYFAPAPRPAAYRRAALLDTYYYNMNKSRSFTKIWRTAL